MSSPSTSVDCQRKSRRLQVKHSEDDTECYTRFDDFKSFDRGTIPPIGTQRTPFKFPKEANDRAAREQKKLNVAVSMGKKCILPIKNNTVLVGEKHQAIVGEFMERSVKDREDQEEKEEQQWKPVECEDTKYDSIRNIYFRAIWRQFNRQIPFEIALQHLMQNNYSMPASLETVDQCLKTVPQVFKPLANVQMEKFEKLYKKKEKDTANRHIQETCMRNHHICEVQRFYHDYKRTEKPVPGACNCLEPLVQDLDFQPRWACSNCTKGLRESPLPLEMSCLLCKTYEEMTGCIRPAKNPVFLQEELQKIQVWDKLEKEHHRRISKEEFEEIQKKENIERLMRQELTEEEKDIIDITQIPNRRKKNPSEEEKKKIGEKLVEQLEPRPLPLFRKCQCGGKTKIEEIRQVVILPEVRKEVIVAEILPFVPESDEKKLVPVELVKLAEHCPIEIEPDNKEIATKVIEHPKAEVPKKKADKKRYSRFHEDLEQLPTKRQRKPKKQYDV